MCINAFFAARFQTDLRRQWIAAGYYCFPIKSTAPPISSPVSPCSQVTRLASVLERLSFSDDALRSIFFPKMSRDTSYMTYVMSFSWKNRSCSVVSAWTSPFHFHYFPTIYLLSWSFKLYITKWCFYLIVGVVLIRRTKLFRVVSMCLLSQFSFVLFSKQVNSGLDGDTAL